MRKVFSACTLMFTCFLTAQVTEVNETVTPGKIKSHISFIASDELRGRDTGSPEIDIAAQYIASRLLEYGIDPIDSSQGYFQQVPLKAVSAPKSGVIATPETSLAIGSDALLMDGSDGYWKTSSVFVNYGMPKDFEKTDVSGKVVVAICGSKTERDPRKWLKLSREKRALAQQLGAVGLIELYNSPQIPWVLLVPYLSNDKILIDEAKPDQSEPLLTLWVNDGGNDKVSLFQGSLIEIKIEGTATRKFQGKNVVGISRGTDPKLKDEYVLFGAHYDHVGVGQPDSDGDSIYNGSRDNAVGTVTVLSMAEHLAKYPAKRSALFVFFTAEEKGLLGSKFFSDHSIIPLEKIVYCFNSDGAGYNDTSVATIIGLERTTAKADIVEACETYELKAIEDPAPEQGLFDRSDNVSFAKKGIPAPTFSLGLTSFNEEINKYYHQPADNPESLDYDYLLRFFRAYVLAGKKIANSESRQFWIKGDKYFEAGEKLYGLKNQ